MPLPDIARLLRHSWYEMPSVKTDSIHMKRSSFLGMSLIVKMLTTQCETKRDSTTLEMSNEVQADDWISGVSMRCSNAIGGSDVLPVS